MNRVTCCGKSLKAVYNVEDILRARYKGLPDDEAYDFGLKGFLCEKCRTWYEENDSGKMFVVHLPTNERINL